MLPDRATWRLSEPGSFSLAAGQHHVQQAASGTNPHYATRFKHDLTNRLRSPGVGHFQAVESIDTTSIGTEHPERLHGLVGAVSPPDGYSY
jgi:hypothetical protein